MLPLLLLIWLLKCASSTPVTVAPIREMTAITPHPGDEDHGVASLPGVRKQQIFLRGRVRHRRWL